MFFTKFKDKTKEKESVVIREKTEIKTKMSRKDLRIIDRTENNAIYPTDSINIYNRRMNNCLLEEKYGSAYRRWRIEQLYFDQTGRFPNLDNPVTFNEKLQWMRLHYHDPLMVKCVNKVTFKDYIRETIGEEYVVPLYGVWSNVNNIDWDSLPNKFCIKTNWGWGNLQNILVLDKANCNKDLIKAELNNWIQPWNNYYFQSFEWDSKDIEPVIFAEQLLEPSNGSIIDYKFFCYGGVCKHFLVCKDRQTETKFINYDSNLNCIIPSPNSYVDKEPFEKSKEFTNMWEISEKLSKPFPFARVDFYSFDEKIYVGEMTFSPGGGFNTYTDEWDTIFGNFLVLPEANID